jgi:aromatic-L-amino-acid decarboxylase
MDEQFDETSEQVVRRLSQCTDNPFDEKIIRRNSIVLTHFHQLANIGAIPSVGDIKRVSRESMSESSPVSHTSTLDPQDWKSARAEAHKMLDVSLDFLEKARDRPAWIPLPNQVRRRLICEALPEHGKSMEEVCQDIIDDVLPYSGGNTHPRFWGWVHGSGTVGGVIAEMMTAAMNSNVGLCSHSGVLIERQVIEWMRQLFEFPITTAGGVIVSGTSMAAVVCLAVARYHALNKIRQEGLVALGVRLVAYSSTQTHVCVAKALELLGLGIQALRLVPVDDEYRIDIQALKTMIQEDRQQGLVPFCIVGNAGIAFLKTKISCIAH